MKTTSAKSAQPKIELLPPSITLRMGRRRLTLSWRARKPLPSLLSTLLRRSWRQVLAPVLKVSVAAAAVCGAWQTQALAAAPAPGTLPSGWSVVNGNVVFTQNGNTLNINQLSPQAIANFLSFSIGSDAAVNISQPGAAAAFLAKVTGGDISQIYGKLTAPGTVVLFNPNGVMVGAGGVVDVGRFVATTLNISNDDFLAGKLTFAKDRANVGAVENYGNITSATGGSVYLIGSSVTNGGIIKSPQGEVILAAGQSVTLADTATPGVTVNVTGSTGDVTNLGTITAEAGRIGIAAGLISNSGNISASSVVREGGRIFLRASGNLTTTANSSITADGTTGGNITLYADNKAFIDGDVSATGSAGNGGFVETSGLGSLDVVKVPTVGAGGTWYIDPYDLEVVSTGGLLQGVTGCGSIYAITSSLTGGSKVANLTIETQLNLGVNVTLATGAGGSASGGNITVNADIVKISGGNASLTLNADNNININSDIRSTSGSLGLTLHSNYSGIGVTTDHTAQLNNHNISLNGGELKVLTGVGSSTNGDLSINGASGIVVLGGGGKLQAANVTVGHVNSQLSLAGANSVAITGTLRNSGQTVMTDVADGVQVNGLVNSGQLTVENSTVTVATAASNAGTLTLGNSANVNLQGGMTNSGTLENSNFIVGSATINAGADVTNTNTGTISFTGGPCTTINVNGAGQWINNGEMTVSSGAVFQGAVVNNANFTLGYAAVLGLQAGMTNNGNFTSSISFGSAQINASGAVINSATGNMSFGGTCSTISLGGSAGWTNEGNLSVSGSTTLQNTGTVGMLNNGTITLSGGTMTMRDFNNGLTGIITGNGTIGSSKGFFNNGILTPGGTGTFGSLNINGDFTQSDSGEMRIDIGSSNTDQITFSGGYVHLGGTLRTGLVGITPALNQSFTPFTLNGGIPSLDNSYFHTVTGDVLTVSGAKQMLKATYGVEGMKLTMLGSATFYFGGGGSANWADRDSWSASASSNDAMAYLPTQIDDVVVNSGTLAHTSGTDTVNSVAVGGTGTLNMSGGDLKVIGSASVGGTASMNVNDGNVSAGSVAVGGLSTLNLYGGNISSSSVTLADNGRIDLSGGNLSVSGSTSMGDYSQLIMNAGTLTSGSTLINGNATVRLGAGDMTLGNTSIGDAARVIVSGGNVTMANASINGELDFSNGNITLTGLTTGSGSVVMTQAGGEGGGEEGGGQEGGFGSLSLTNGSKSFTMADAQSNLDMQLWDVNFNFSGSVRVGTMKMYGNSFVTGAGGSRLNVARAFYQESGSLNVDTAVLNNNEGTLFVGDITANNLALNAGNGSIAQNDYSSLHIRKQLIASARDGIELGSGDSANATNYIAAFAANNSGAGNVTLVNHLNADDASVVTINGVSTANGSVSIENYGGMRTQALGSNGDFLTASTMYYAPSQWQPENLQPLTLDVMGIKASGKIDVTGGAATLRTHSPLTIGSGGIGATGGISLTAGDPGDPTGALVINGLLSTAGILNTTGNSVAVNANIVAGSWAVPSNPSPVYGSNVLLNIGGTTTLINPVSSSSNIVNTVAQQTSQQQQNQQTQNLQSSVNGATVSSDTSSTGAVQQATNSNNQTAGGTAGNFGDESEGKKDGGKKPLPMCT